MEARAIVRNVRMTPRKIKLICDLIRGKDAGTAMAILAQTPKSASEPLGPGPIMKRVMPRAQGRAYRILKRTSHITLVLGEKE